MRMRSCFWSERCHSLPFFLFYPFASYPSVLHRVNPASTNGFGQGNTIKQKKYRILPLTGNQPLNVIRIWSIGICSYTGRLNPAEDIC